MNVKSVKALAAAVMVATGFGLSVGGGWSGEAVAQVSGLPPAKVAPVDPKLDKLKADLEKAKAELAKAEAEVDAKVRENFQQRLLLAWGAAREAPKYEYEPVPERGLQVGLFEKMLTEREKNGWEFLGQVTLLKATVEGREAKLVFRKKPPVDARALWVLPQNAPLPPGGIMPPAPKVVKPSDPDAPPAFAPVRPGAALPTPTVVPGGPILPLPMPGSPPPPGSAGARPNANGGLGERLARFENAVLEKFQGSWRLTGWELAGGKLTAEEMKARDDVMVIEGNNFTYLDKGQKVYFGRIAVDSTQDPPTLLLLGTDRKQDMYTWCIYELDGDTLRICKDVKGKGRPTEFKASENTVIQSYRRTK